MKKLFFLFLLLISYRSLAVQLCDLDLSADLQSIFTQIKFPDDNYDSDQALLIPYLGAKNILFLSDARSLAQEYISLGDILHRKLKDLPQNQRPTIVSTDIYYNKNTEATDIESAHYHLDNSKFPYKLNELEIPDNSNDVIVLRRGLCPCDGYNLCAGVPALGEETEKFFREVVRILNKNNKNSMAFFTGDVETIRRK
ncbi:MAG: hypothetical protein QE271_10210 [Bacteriovoracaceae bacterium]|nr:hypothetical protein [Bacteriovoracaceae bacterium]